MPVLTRSAHKGAPTLIPAPGLTLLQGRAHEACGPARISFALMLAQVTAGPVLWIRLSHAEGQLTGDGIRDWIEPGRIIFVTPDRPRDLFWAAEEALRSGAAPLTILELTESPPLTPVRRLHLAAESAGTRPTLLLLTPGEGGAQGIETRWYTEPAPGWATPAGQPAWGVTRTRARLAPPATWRIEREGKSLSATPAPLRNPAEPQSEKRTAAAARGPGFSERKTGEKRHGASAPPFNSVHERGSIRLRGAGTRHARERC
ncbi:MAG: hypothetical protein AAFY59_16230, partial [Pseudomonadota bacterium]